MCYGIAIDRFLFISVGISKGAVTLPVKRARREVVQVSQIKEFR